MRTTYAPTPEGEWFELPRRHRLWIACCYCGLVHETQTKIRGRKVFMRVWRNDRATATRRRSLKQKRKRR